MARTPLRLRVARRIAPIEVRVFESGGPPRMRYDVLKLEEARPLRAPAHVTVGRARLTIRSAVTADWITLMWKRACAPPGQWVHELPLMEPGTTTIPGELHLAVSCHHLGLPPELDRLAAGLAVADTAPVPPWEVDLKLPSWVEAPAEEVDLEPPTLEALPAEGEVEVLEAEARVEEVDLEETEPEAPAEELDLQPPEPEAPTEEVGLEVTKVEAPEPEPEALAEEVDLEETEPEAPAEELDLEPPEAEALAEEDEVEAPEPEPEAPAEELDLEPPEPETTTDEVDLEETRPDAPADAVDLETSEPEALAEEVDHEAPEPAAPAEEAEEAAVAETAPPPDALALSAVQDRLQRMDPRAFRDLILDLLEHLDYRDARAAETSAEGEMDLTAWRNTATGPQKVAIRCLQRSDPLGVDAARDLAMVVSSDPSIEKGLLVTTGGLALHCREFIRIIPELEAIDGPALARRVMEFNLLAPED